MARLSHPSYVYTASFHPVTHSLVVTGGFDRVIRLWRRDREAYIMVQVSTVRIMALMLFRKLLIKLSQYCLARNFSLRKSNNKSTNHPNDVKGKINTNKS